MSQKLEDAGYDTQEMKRRSRRGKMRRVLRGIAVVLVVVGLGVLAADYLSRLPRERHAMNFSYAKRVLLGAKNAAKAALLTMQSYQEDPKSSKLPIVELYVKGKRLDKLNEDLPQSGANYQKAKLFMDGEVYSAEVRYRGDSINHWAFPNKSWRVQLRKGEHHDGMNVMNFAVPRTETQISNWLGYQLIERFDDIIFPEASFVHFRLNRKYDGLRLFLEQPDQDFLKRRNLPYGKIYVGDIDSSQIYGGVKRKRLYQDPSAWSVRAPMETADGTEMETLISIIQNENTPYRFYYAMSDLMDMRSLLKYMAMLELVGSVHVDETHNGKFYFHPTKGKFMPIGWDTVAYMWKDSKGIDIAANNLFRTVLSNPEFRERKDRYLWNAIHGAVSSESVTKLIRDIAKKLRPDIYSFPLKIAANDKGLRHLSNDEWEDSVAELLSIVPKRHSRLVSELEKSEVAHRLVDLPHESQLQSDEQGVKNQGLSGTVAQLLGVKVSSRSGFRLEKLILDTDAPDGAKVELVRRGLDDLLYEIKPEERRRFATVKAGKATFALGDVLYSKRRFERASAEVVPSNYAYLLRIDRDGAKITGARLKGVNSVSGKAVSSTADAALEVPAEHAENIVWWEPTRLLNRTEKVLSGKIRLDSDLVIDDFRNLKILPGTEIEMEPGVSIFVRNGSIIAEGTAERPIVVRASDPALPWGVIAVHDGALSRFRHLNIIGGSEDRFKFVRYSGALSVHGGTASLENSSFSGSYISAMDTELSLSNVKVDNILPFYIQSERAVLRQEGVKHDTLAAVHLRQNMQFPAFGTPARAEREFKWTVDVGKSGFTLDELSGGILEALRLSVGDGGWAAPVHTGTEYYVDDTYKDFAFRDIYFDTPDNLNYQHQLSYRLRNRYSGRSGYRIHVKSPNWPEQWPYRLEFQAKFDRQELEHGFSTVDEARFEFRKESKPFSEENLPPPPPWDLEEFIPYFEAGHFKGLHTLPAQAVMKYYDNLGVPFEKLAFSPRLVLMTERFRQHLNIKSPWGSGPNPEQSFIISLDCSEVYGATSYLKALRNRALGDKKAKVPDEIGRLIEIEIEFERNVSDVLDQRIKKAMAEGDTAGAKELEAAREAFLSDQQRIMTVVKDYFVNKGVDVYPASKSKYVQAFEMAVLGALPEDRGVPQG